MTAGALQLILADMASEAKDVRTVANEHMKGAVRDEWHETRKRMLASRGGKLVLPDRPLAAPSAFASVKQAIYARALVVLDDIACHAPSNRDRIRAAEVIVDHELQCQRYEDELTSKAPPLQAASAPVKLTDEQAAQVREQLYQRRMQLRKDTSE